MFKKPVIHLLKGFCSLNFGAPIDSAVAIFNEPEEIQTLNDELLNTNTLVYHYWDQGFSLFFDANKNNVFCSAEIDNRDTTLLDLQIFSLREKEIIALMKQNGYPLSDTEVHQWGEKRISFDTAGLDCYFENNKLVSVNVSVVEIPYNFLPN